MSQAKSYSPSHSFVADSATLANFPGQSLDIEFNNVKTTTDALGANLALIQRDDGQLANGAVTYDSLSTALQANGLAPATAWMTGVAYPAGVAVVEKNNLYRAVVAHTSGVFATDLAAGKWVFVAALANTTFIQSGTGAVSRTVQDKARDIVSVRDFGAKGDGVTDDTAAINAAIAALKAAGGDLLYFPRGNYISSGQIALDASVWMIGAGPNATKISVSGNLATALLAYNGSGGSQGFNFRMSGFTLVGPNRLAGSIGLQLQKLSRSHIDNVVIQFFDTAFDATDVDQSQFQNVVWCFNNKGGTFNAAAGITDANNIIFTGCAVANNTVYGLSLTNANLFTYQNGSIQFNGQIGGGPTQFGVSLINCGGGATFQNVDLEGNGGISSVVVDQTSNVFFAQPTFQFIGSNFYKSVVTTVGFATDDILVTGTAAATLRFSGNTFWSGGGYTPSAWRGTISISNTAALVLDDQTNFFQDALEVPVYPAGQTVKLPVAFGGTGDNGSAWTAYSPTVTAGSGAFTTVSAAGRYKTIGKTVHVEVTITTIGTAATSMLFTLPLASQSGAVLSGINASTGATVSGLVGASGVVVFRYDGAFPAAAGNQFTLSGVYESQ